MTNHKNTLHILGRLACAAVCTAAVLMSAMTAVFADSTLIISDFADAGTVWTAGDNVTAVELSEFSWEQDGQSYTRSCLKVTSDNVRADTIRGTVARFEGPLDLSEYRTMSFDIYVPALEADPDAVFLTRLTLMSADGDSTEHLEMLKGGEWNHVEAYIGSWDGREAIFKAEIALAVDTVLRDHPADCFYIDDVSASEPVDREMLERYLFDSYTVSGGSATLAGDKSKITIVSDDDSEMSLEAAVFRPEIDYAVNCLRIRLVNRTDSDTLTVHYSTSDSQVATEDKSVTVPIEPNSDVRDYYAYVGDAAQLHSIKLMFGAAEGRVELISISAVSAYEPYEYETCGTLTVCKVNDDLASVTFAGEIDRETALASQNGYIAIYEHTSDELPTEKELADMTPLVKGTMTTRFELSWQLPRDGSYGVHTRFIAAAVGEDGSYKLICAPFYVTNPERFAKSSYPLAVDSKGFAANDLSLVGDSDTGISVLELDARELFVSKNEAEPYIYRGEAYYFSGTYLDTLASKINVLHAADVQVLLRIYNWEQSYGEELSALYAEDDYINYAKVSNSSDGVDYIGAVGSYIANKWAADGKVVGVIYGEGENIIAEHETLSTMTAQTSRDLRSLYLNLAQANPDAKVYVSLTDMYSAATQTGNAELGLAEYLPALIAETARCGQFPWEIALERIYRIGDTDGCEFVTVDSCDAIRGLLSDTDSTDKHMIFLDRTYSAPNSRLGTAMKTYVIGAYSAYFSADIDAYIAITGSRGSDIAETVRYIDSSEASVVIDMAKIMLKVDDLSELIDGFDINKLPGRRLVAAEATTTQPTGIKGTFNYYRFDGVSSIGGLSPSYYSRELRIANDGGSVLSVELDSELWDRDESAAWLGIGHSFDIPENLRLTPTLAITLKVENVAPATLSEVPVKLVLKGENERFEATATVNAGEWTTLYVSTGDFRAAKDTEGLQILIGNSEVSSATLKIRSIDGLSREYNDESLESVIAESRLKKSSPEQDDGYGAYLPIAIGVLIAVATIIAVMLLSRRKGTKRE